MENVIFVIFWKHALGHLLSARASEKETTWCLVTWILNGIQDVVKSVSSSLAAIQMPAGHCTDNCRSIANNNKVVVVGTAREAHISVLSF